MNHRQGKQEKLRTDGKRNGTKHTCPGGTLTNQGSESNIIIIMINFLSLLKYMNNRNDYSKGV